MKTKSKLLAVLLGTMALAVSVPAAAFADNTPAKSHTMTYIAYLKAEDYDNHTDSPVAVDKHMDADTIVMPTEYEGYQLSYLELLGKDGSYVMDIHPGISLPVSTLIEMSGATEDEYGWTVVDIYARLPEDYKDTVANQPTMTPAPAAPETTAAAPAEDNTPAVDTRTEQQKEIDEAIANGTWGIEYTTCQKCGYHNWTRQGNVYVCDTCGNETTTVIGPKGVKGYVGSGAIAAVAPKASAPETRYATAAEAQAAADKREAAYAAAVAAFQKQIDAQNAAYLAALGK